MFSFRGSALKQGGKIEWRLEFLARYPSPRGSLGSPVSSPVGSGPGSFVALLQTASPDAGNLPTDQWGSSNTHQPTLLNKTKSASFTGGKLYFTAPTCRCCIVTAISTCEHIYDVVKMIPYLPVAMKNVGHDKIKSRSVNRWTTNGMQHTTNANYPQRVNTPMGVYSVYFKRHLGPFGVRMASGFRRRQQWPCQQCTKTQINRI